MLDQREFADRYRAAAPTLRVVAISEVGASDADDVVQQAAIVAWERRDRFESGTDFRAWVAAIVRGVAKNHRRGERRRDQRHRRAADQAVHHTERPSHADGAGRDTSVATSGHIATTPHVGGLSETLRDGLGSLGETQRACLLLRVLLDHSYDEIAAIAGVPAATARSHVRRARLKLAGVVDAPAGRIGGRSDG